jgi:hypothetical protein
MERQVEAEFRSTESSIDRPSNSDSQRKINLQRAEELLKLYADIETQEPDLNPDSVKE